MMSFESPAIAEHQSPGHWTIASGTADAMAAFLRPGPGADAKAPRPHRITVEGRPATEFVIPPFNQFHGIYGGHVVIQWSRGGQVVQVSAHGRWNKWMAFLLARVLIRA
jgi:hypothetical protein